MRVTRLTTADVAGRSLGALGLDPNATDVSSPEAIYASLRRSASFLCPATPRQLVDAVRDALAPLYPVGLSAREDVMDQLDLLVTVGDLLELRDPASNARRIYLGPPSFVVKSPDSYLLLGVRPFGAPLVDSSLSSKILYEGHTRTLAMEADAAIAWLTAAGLRELKLDQWLQRPHPQRPGEVLAELRNRLSAAGPTGQVEGLTLIDPAAPVRYYRGRWRGPKADDDGDFVARRPQAYGADLWCMVRLQFGQPIALVDLPLDPTATGRDEAWRLQAALDAERGVPQLFRTQERGRTSASHVVDLFGPIPGWAERYLELTGSPLNRSSGALLSYRIPTSVAADAKAFLVEMLWMTTMDEEGSR